MGGTWVSHVHGRLFAEMQRYGLKDSVSMTRTEGGGAAYFTIDTGSFTAKVRTVGESLTLAGSGSRQLSLKKASEMTFRAWRIFINADGQDGRSLCPLPYSSLGNSRITREEVEAIDKISCQDRIDQVADLLTPDEKALIESLVPHCTGGTAANTGFLEMLRAQALQGYTPETFEECWTLYKIKEGQSTLARNIFDDAHRLGLQYAFKQPVRSFVEKDDNVTVTTASGRAYKAKRVINTLPLAVLPTVKFDPPLSKLRQEAIQIGHVNHLTKVHAEVKGDLRGLRGCTFPGELLYVYGDGFCHGDESTRITSFAGDNRGVLNPLQQPEKLVTALKRFHPMEIKKVVSANITHTHD
jgi:glycine/D-amino acid oxidase-like deaminating enzyme